MNVLQLDHPFYIHSLTKTVDGVPTTWFGVDYNSSVRDGVSWTNVTITGLLTTPSPTDDDAGWQDSAVGYIYLEGGMEADGTCSSISVEVGAADMSEKPRIESDSGVQTVWRAIIGYVWQDGDTWYVRQEASRDFTLMYVVVNGVLCKVPFVM